jgi:NTP pyrophosphatase (non-canonical NTP hydrolase)
VTLTLLEAQKLSAKIFKEINEKLDVIRGKSWDPFVIVTDLLEEAGEVASTVKGLEGYKPPEKPKTKQMLAAELSDLLYAIFVLAEHYNLNLQETFIETIQNYKSRFL